MNAIVECSQLTKSYRQSAIEVPALRGIDLTVEQGEFASLAGPSGSGKTTLLNLIGGLDRPTSGTVRLAGKDLGSLGSEALAALRLDKIGFVFQAYNLVPVLSAIENVEFVLQLSGVDRRARRECARAMLRRVGLEGLEDRRPADLSGGQQQRVAVARALVSRPVIVLADEPTANLDSRNAEELMTLMSQLNRDSHVTFLMATHDPRVIALTRRHIVITDGRISSDARRAEAAAG